MLTQVARALGVVFVLVGLLGFVPALARNGMLLGIFPINSVHNAVHLALGVWGLVVAKSAAGALGYLKAITVIYAVLAVLGLLPATNTLFGLAPIHGADIVLHGLLALVAGYFAFGAPSKAAA